MEAALKAASIFPIMIDATIQVVSICSDSPGIPPKIILNVSYASRSLPVRINMYTNSHAFRLMRGDTNEVQNTLSV